MHVTFLMGLYQAVRLRQSVVPIHFIDLDRGVINYPGKIVKGREGFSQPIDPTFAPTLKAIMEHRRSIGEQARRYFVELRKSVSTLIAMATGKPPPWYGDKVDVSRVSANVPQVP